MADFNKDTLSIYFDSRDWLGAAKYLSQFKGSGVAQNNALRKHIQTLERQGQIQSAILSKMGATEQEAFHFMCAMEGSSAIPHTQKDKNGKPILNTGNSFGDAYIEVVNNFKDKDGNVIKTIDLPFNNQEKLNEFYKKLDIKPTDLQGRYNCQIITDPKTGTINLRSNTNNLKLAKLFEAYDFVIPEKIQNTRNLTPYNAPAISSEFETADDRRLAVTDIYNSQANQALFFKQQITNIYNKAKRLNDSSLDKYKMKELEEEMYVTPFLGQGQMEAYNMVAKGQLSMDDYKKIVDERTDVYNRLLAQSDFSQYKVYANVKNEDGNNILRAVDNFDSSEYKTKLLVALQDKRVNYSAAIHGGESGTYITISPEKDKEGNLSKGDLEQEITLFIPNLFKSSCDEVFERDTKTLAVRDLADMKHWEYGKTLADGSYIGYDAEHGAYTTVTDENGNSVKMSVDESYLLQRLNEENIINQAVSSISNYLNDDGTPKETTKDGQRTQYSVEGLIDLVSAQGVNDLYPSNQYSEDVRANAKHNLYVTISKILNWNVEQSNLNE